MFQTERVLSRTYIGSNNFLLKIIDLTFNFLLQWEKLTTPFEQGTSLNLRVTVGFLK